MSKKYLNIFLTVSHPSSRRTPSEEEWYWSTFSFHCMIICTVPIEVLFVVSVSCQIGQGGTFPWWGRAAFEMLSCSPLPSKLHVSVPSPYSHLGLPAFWNWQFQSYLRGIFRLISPLTETSWEYSLPLKVRAFKVTSNFRIISLNLFSYFKLDSRAVNTYCISTSVETKQETWSFCSDNMQNTNSLWTKEQWLPHEERVLYICMCMHMYMCIKNTVSFFSYVAVKIEYYFWSLLQGLNA